MNRRGGYELVDARSNLLAGPVVGWPDSIGQAFAVVVVDNAGGVDMSWFSPGSADWKHKQEVADRHGYMTQAFGRPAGGVEQVNTWPGRVAPVLQRPPVVQSPQMRGLGGIKAPSARGALMQRGLDMLGVAAGSRVPLPQFPMGGVGGGNSVAQFPMGGGMLGLPVGGIRRY